MKALDYQEEAAAHGQAAETPSDIALALTGRPYVSYSEISAYQSCPLKWHLRYVDMAESESLSAAMLLGTCVHAAIQQHLEAFMALDTPPTMDQLMATCRETWKRDAERTPIEYSRGQNEESMEATAERMLKEFLTTEFARPGGSILAIEEPLRIGLADDLPELAARVDMMEHRDGQLIITDYKSARSMWSPAVAVEKAEQLVLYGHAAAPLARDLGATIRLQFVVITKTKEPKIEALSVETNPDRVERSIAIIRQVFRSMRSGAVYPAPSPVSCGCCSYKGRCEGWHRRASQ